MDDHGSLSKFLMDIYRDVEKKFSSTEPGNPVSPCSTCHKKKLRDVGRLGSLAFKRDANGGVLATPSGPEFITSHSGADGRKFMLKPYDLELQNGTRVSAFKSLGLVDDDDVLIPDGRMDTDCHGVTFTDGEYWINDDQVDRILSGGGFYQTNTASVGDVMIFRGGNDAIVHSVTVVEVSDEGVPLKVSGLGGLEMTEHEDVPENAWSDPSDPKVTREVWTRNPLPVMLK